MHRLPRLDGVRAIAILLVLFHQFDLARQPASLVARVEDAFFDRGWVGVQLFFVLSGFLITGILLDARGQPHSYRDFIVRRALRIFPLYFAALALFTVVLPALALAPSSYADHAVWYWLFLSNWTQPHLGGELPHFWSLAVEEQFYLLWPLLVLRMERRQVLRTCGLVIVASFAARWAMRAWGVSEEVVYMSTLSRAEALAAGAAAAAWIRGPGALDALARHRGRLASCALAVALLGFAATGFQRTTLAGQTLGYLALSVVFGAAILLLAVEDARCIPSAWTAWLRSRVLRHVALYSYAMYVFHKPIHDLVGKHLLTQWGYGKSLPPWGAASYILAGVAVTFAAGAASYHLLERHFLALRGRLTRPRPGNLPG